MYADSRIHFKLDNMTNLCLIVFLPLNLVVFAAYSLLLRVLSPEHQNSVTYRLFQNLFASLKLMNAFNSRSVLLM